MCNPRRVHITVTKEVSAAWEAAITEAAFHEDRVFAEARIRERLDETMAESVLRALEAALMRGVEGWDEIEAGFRHDLEGGYCIYHLDDRSLEIVARAEMHIRAEGEASRILSGLAEGEITAQGLGDYFDDGWRGLDAAFGEKQAQKGAEKCLKYQEERLIYQAQQAAQAEAQLDVKNEAQEKAKARWKSMATEAKARLKTEAEGDLDRIGQAAKYAFHQLLARAYRDTLLILARKEGAEIVHHRENGEHLEIELRLKS